MAIRFFRSVSVVTYKLIELNKTCMAAILKTLSKVMNENRRNKVFTVIKQITIREYSAHTDFFLNCYVLVTFNSKLSISLTSCIQNVVDILRGAVDVTS